MRLGFVANFISEPVLKGFIIGLALTIIVGPAAQALRRREGRAATSSRSSGTSSRHLGDTDWRTLLVGLISFAIVVGFRRFLPVDPGLARGGRVRSRRGLRIRPGRARRRHRRAPSTAACRRSGCPTCAATDYLELAGELGGHRADRLCRRPRSRQDVRHAASLRDRCQRASCSASGPPTSAPGLSSGMVVNGSLSKTAVNGGAGAKSQVSGLVVAALTIVTLLFLTGLFEKLPEATLAAVVIAAVIELVDIAALRRLYRVSSVRGQQLGIAARPDFVAAIAAMLGVLIFDTLPGLVIGIACSLVLLVYRASRPHISELGKSPGDPHRWSDLERHPDDRASPASSCCGSRRACSSRTPTTCARRCDMRRRSEGTRAVILDAETVAFIDVTAADMLATLTGELASEGVAADRRARCRPGARHAARDRGCRRHRPQHVRDRRRGDRGARSYRSPPRMKFTRAG